MEQVGEILISTRRIQRRVKALAQQINRDYAGRELVLICVLKGSFMLLSDLMRHLTIPTRVDFIATSSYGSSTETSGVVRLTKDLDEDIESQHVLIVEDIVDTGLTLNYLLKTLSARHPATMKVLSLLDSPTRRRVPVEIHY
ncbi:MAG: hypoxanthine phosphoribosyltransferase, partial [bacterium]